MVGNGRRGFTSWLCGGESRSKFLSKPISCVDDTSLETIVRRFQDSMSEEKTHKLWETQPVGQFKDIGDTSLPEGPIEPATPLSEVKQEPYNLPAAYEWTTCDMKSDYACSEVYNLLKNNYVEDDENMFRFNYSKEFLTWALRPPGYYQSWHIGVRAKTSKKLVAFISGVPARIRVHDDVVKMAEINFLCVHKKLRSKRLAPVMIKEVTRRVHLENIWQAAYTAGVVLPTPVATCQYWHRTLNPKKLIDVGFSRLGARMTMSRTIKLYKLPDVPVTPGFRKMEPCDVPAVTRLLRNYLSQFLVATDFDENDVEHWLLPREDVVDSYLVESPETHDVTDFCSFYTLPSTILGNPNYTTLKAAYSYYNVATRTTFLQLMNDALIVAKQKGFDVFNALDVMHNESFLKELKFGPGDGQLHHYLYNYRLRNASKPSELGLVLLGAHILTSYSIRISKLEFWGFSYLMSTVFAYFISSEPLPQVSWDTDAYLIYWQCEFEISANLIDTVLRFLLILMPFHLIPILYGFVFAFSITSFWLYFALKGHLTVELQCS